MRALLALALVGAAGLAACTQPEPADPPPAGTPAADPSAAPDAEPISTPFDAAVWMASVESAETDEERIALSARLLDAVDWRTACGEDDPTAPGRGIVRLLHLDRAPGGPALAEITCSRAAYQSTFALVDARAGRPPRLVRALGVTEAGTVTADTTASFFGVASHDAAGAPGRFDVATKSAGHGGCGTLVRYRLRADGGASIEEVRAHTDCGAPLAPEAWPVTFAQ